MRDEEGEKEEEEWEAAEPLASEFHVGGKGGSGVRLVCHCESRDFHNSIIPFEYWTV